MSKAKTKTVRAAFTPSIAALKERRDQLIADQRVHQENIGKLQAAANNEVGLLNQIAGELKGINYALGEANEQAQEQAASPQG